jgi:hypothetical protein
VEQQQHTPKPVSLWSSAVQATLHCLTGCAIGEVLGMVLATAFGWGNATSIAVSIGLAFFFGYALTVRPVLRAGVELRRAVRVAFASDTVSITTMEIVDNAFILIVPGALAAGLADGLFWWSLAVSLVIAFVLTVPVNRWLISRGRGHAVMHELHAHTSPSGSPPAADNRLAPRRRIGRESSGQQMGPACFAGERRRGEEAPSRRKARPLA